jgi:hypothetical protein
MKLTPAEITQVKMALGTRIKTLETLQTEDATESAYYTDCIANCKSALEKLQKEQP